MNNMRLFLLVSLCAVLVAGCPEKRPEADSEKASSSATDPGRQRPGAPDDMPVPTPPGETSAAKAEPTGKPQPKPGPEPGNGPKGEVLKADVLKAANARIAAWKARDLNAVMSFYDPGVVATFEGNEEMDLQQIRHLYREEFTDKAAAALNYAIDTVWASPQMAVVQFTRITNGGAGGVRDRGVEVWRKGAEGAWRLHRVLQYHDTPDDGQGRLTKKPLPAFDPGGVTDEAARARAKEVEAASKQIYAAYQVLDMEAMGKLIAEDALFMFPGRPDRSKAAALRDLGQLAAAKATITVNHGVEEIIATDTLAVVRFVIAQSARVPRRGMLKSTERGMDVWRKDADGAWRIIGSAQFASEY